ncbi:MAG: hypothetical protein WCQ60_00230 [bacterium]
MYTTIIIFYIALAGIILMLVLKRAEVKSGNTSILARLGAGADTFVRVTYDTGRFVISHINVHNGIVAVQWFAYHALSALRTIYLRASELAHSHPHSRKVIDMVTGRGELTGKGGASFYLKRIGETEKSGVK